MTAQSTQPVQADQLPQSGQATQPDIIHTWTNGALMLVIHSFLPIMYGFIQRAGVSVDIANVSLAGRILAALPLVSDDLVRLGEFTQSPAATITKLLNIPASLPQFKAAIVEFQALGHEIPDYLDSPTMPIEREACAAYDAVKGNAVNLVLCEGNSNRHVPAVVKAYTCSHPRSTGAWSSQSRTHVATMGSGDFWRNERNAVVSETGTLQVRLHPADGGEPVVLRGSPSMTAGEVVDVAFMSAAALDEFLAQRVPAAKGKDLLLLVHFKATMMKVPDPIISGHAVHATLLGVFSTHGRVLAGTGLCAEDRLASTLASLDSLPQGEQIRATIEIKLAVGLRLLTVDSNCGVTSLHVSSGVIIDTSMPAMIRAGGYLWGPDGQAADTLAVIPGSSYAGAYQAVIDDCRAHGALNPVTMDSAPDMGLMTRKAGEYDSHDKTFLIPADGIVEVIAVEGVNTELGTVPLSREVAIGDIWWVCTIQDAPTRNRMHLVVTRTRATGALTIFWLDPEHGHDVVLIDLMNRYLTDEDTEGLDARVLDLVAATRLSLEHARHSEDIVSVTGNTLRGCNTDFFPILELGTSAKMLLMAPLMNSGGLYETGVGGSVPKYMHQLLEEGYLRWDSLGELLALTKVFHHVTQVSGGEHAEVLAGALETATARLLGENHLLVRCPGQIDDRGPHAQLALYWAREPAAQEIGPESAAVLSPIAQQLEALNDTIQAELLAVQGSPVDIGGYYRPGTALTNTAM